MFLPCSVAMTTLTLLASIQNQAMALSMERNKVVCGSSAHDHGISTIVDCSSKSKMLVECPQFGLEVKFLFPPWFLFVVALSCPIRGHCTIAHKIPTSK